MMSQILEILTATAAVAEAPIEPTMAVSARDAIQIRNCSRIAGQASFRMVRFKWLCAWSERISGACLFMIRSLEAVFF